MKLKYKISHVEIRSVMRNDVHAAASSVVAFMVAGVIFVGSVGALLVVSRDSGEVSNSPSAAAGLSLQSQALADLIVASPGFHLDANGNFVEDWDTDNADELGRLGLRSTDSALMDFDKFQNLRRAGYAPTNDGRVNYPDARSSLGLDEVGLDFHLRAFPSLQSVRDLLANGERDPNLRVAYLADVEVINSGGGNPADGLVVWPLTCTAGTSTYTLSLPVTNDGLSTTQFSAFFDVDWTGNTADYQDRTRSVLLVPGASATLSLVVPYTAGRTCASGDVDVEVWDPNSELWGAEFPLSGDTATTPVANDLWINPGSSYYLPGEDVAIDFGGDLPGKNEAPVDLALVIKDVVGATVHSQTVTVSSSIRSAIVPGTAFLGPAQYTAELTYPGGVTAIDTVVVTAVAPSAFVPASGSLDYEAQPPVAVEVGFLEALVDNFCPYFHDTASYGAGETPLSPAPGAARCGFERNANPQAGDIFRDTRDVLNNDLPERLLDPADTTYVQQCNGNIVGGPRYDWTRVLVVGSNVDHNAMTSAAAKYAVCEWVMGGGTLIVFGSADQQVQWLQPIFHAAITSSSSPVTTPDASHPILNRADTLAYDGYDDRDQVWSFNGQTANNQAQLLTNVVASGSDTTLSISNPGAFGDGNIILTTWLPYDLFGSGTSELEGLKLVNNFLMQGYRDLFLDYGPEIPSSGRQAAAAQRVVDILHPEFTTPLPASGACSSPELTSYEADGVTPKECFNPITLTIFVYVF